MHWIHSFFNIRIIQKIIHFEVRWKDAKICWVHITSSQTSPQIVVSWFSKIPINIKHFADRPITSCCNACYWWRQSGSTAHWSFTPFSDAMRTCKCHTEQNLILIMLEQLHKIFRAFVGWALSHCAFFPEQFLRLFKRCLIQSKPNSKSSVGTDHGIFWIGTNMFLNWFLTFLVHLSWVIQHTEVVFYTTHWSCLLQERSGEGREDPLRCTLPWESTGWLTKPNQRCFQK